MSHIVPSHPIAGAHNAVHSAAFLATVQAWHGDTTAHHAHLNRPTHFETSTSNRLYAILKTFFKHSRLKHDPSKDTRQGGTLSNFTTFSFAQKWDIAGLFNKSLILSQYHMNPTFSNGHNFVKIKHKLLWNMMTHHNKTLKCFMVYCIIAVISKYDGMMQRMMQRFLLQQKIKFQIWCNPTLDEHIASVICSQKLRRELLKCCESIFNPVSRFAWQMSLLSLVLAAGILQTAFSVQRTFLTSLPSRFTPFHLDTTHSLAHTSDGDSFRTVATVEKRSQTAAGAVWRLLSSRLCGGAAAVWTA